MHEMSIAIEVLGQLERLAVENGLTRIEAFTLQAGVLRGVVPEALEMAFASVAEGTVAEAATIDLQIVPALACCRQCGQEFEPSLDSFLCTQCNQADVEFIAGNDLLLTRVSGETQQDDKRNET